MSVFIIHFLNFISVFLLIVFMLLVQCEYSGKVLQWNSRISSQFSFLEPLIIEQHFKDNFIAGGQRFLIFPLFSVPPLSPSLPLSHLT